MSYLVLVTFVAEGIRFNKDDTVPMRDFISCGVYETAIGNLLATGKIRPI